MTLSYQGVLVHVLQHHLEIMPIDHWAMFKIPCNNLWSFLHAFVGIRMIDSVYVHSQNTYSLGLTPAYAPKCHGLFPTDIIESMYGIRGSQN